MTGALEPRVLVKSSSRAVCEDVLHRTLLMVSDGGIREIFLLSAFLKFESQVLFCNQEVRTSRSEDRLVILWVRIVRCDQRTRKKVQASLAQVKRFIEEI